MECCSLLLNIIVEKEGEEGGGRERGEQRGRGKKKEGRSLKSVLLNWRKQVEKDYRNAWFWLHSTLEKAICRGRKKSEMSGVKTWERMGYAESTEDF